MSALSQERFDRFYIPEPNSGCWLWTSQRNSDGYGIFRVTTTRKSPKISAHRASWILHRGELMQSDNVLHECDTPCCVNPDHLFLGTHDDNMRDMKEKGRARAPQGSAHVKSKLTEKLVAEIRVSAETATSWAKRLGVSTALVAMARRRVIWKHVP